MTRVIIELVDDTAQPLAVTTLEEHGPIDTLRLDQIRRLPEQPAGLRLRFDPPIPAADPYGDRYHERLTIAENAFDAAAARGDTIRQQLADAINAYVTMGQR